MSTQRKCRLCKKPTQSKSHSIKYCKECEKIVKGHLKDVQAKYSALDVCSGDCFVNKDEAYINLAGAIVRLTLEDYEYALAMNKHYPTDMFYISQRKSLERVIESEYFDMLCLNLCPKKLVRDINKLYYGPKGY